MLFQQLNLIHFGRFHRKEIRLESGINIIYGENEAGKSTIHTFLKGMLFGLERSRGRASNHDLYSRYLPWDNPGAYQGSMDITLNGKQYRLYRNFMNNNKMFQILDLDTGREMNLVEGSIRDLIPELTESTFKNTISIEQLKARTEDELRVHLHNYIANMSTAKSNEVDIMYAVNTLTKKKKELEGELNSIDLKKLEREIREGEEKEKSLDSLALSLKDLLIKEQELKQKKDKAFQLMAGDEESYLEQFPVILEKYHNYQVLITQINHIETQMSELKERIAEYKIQCEGLEDIKKHMDEIDMIYQNLQEYETSYEEMIKCRDRDVKKAKNRSLFFCMITTGVIALLYLMVRGVKGFENIGVDLLVIGAIFVSGGIVHQFLHKYSKTKQHYYRRILDILKLITDSKQRMIKAMEEYGVQKISDLKAKYEVMQEASYFLVHNMNQLQECEERLSQLEDHKDHIYEQIMRYMQHFFYTDVLDEPTMEKLKDVVELRKKEILRQIEEQNNLYETCRVQIEKLRWDIATYEENEEKLLNNKEQYQQLQEKVRNSRIELEAITEALQTIQELSIDIHDTFGRKLNQTVSNIVAKVTGNKYMDIKVNENLELKVGYRENYVQLDKLSTGTMEQVYFALRLAIAETILGDYEVPLLLDDSFAYYDDNRVKATLSTLSERSQVILFSCHNREIELLEELQIPYHLIKL